MTSPLAYLSGRFLPDEQLVLSAADAGFVRGATVTDLCRTFRRRLFRLSDHLVRFRAGCASAYVPLLLDDAELTNTAERLVEHNSALIDPDEELILVMFATPGPIGRLTGADRDGPPTLGLHTFKLPFHHYRPLFEKGATLVVPETRQPSAASIDPRIKHRSRLFWWIAQHQVHADDPDADALLTDADGFVTETATANLLVVKDGRVQTPWSGRALNGVGLAVVRELCRDLSVPFDETDLTLADCRTIDEAMLTNSAFCLAPVASIQRRKLTCPGPLFERLLTCLSERVGVDVRGQFLGG